MNFTTVATCRSATSRSHRLSALVLIATMITACSSPPTPSTPTTGYLAVVVAGLPVTSTVSLVVDGPAGFHRSLTGPASLGSVTPGSYQIVADTSRPNGFTFAPNPVAQSIAVTTGSSVTASVNYLAVDGKLAVAVSGLPVGVSATVSVTGPGGFLQVVGTGMTLSGLLPGSYQVTAVPAINAGVVLTPSPANQTLTVTAGATTNAAVAFSSVPSRTFDPLPSGYLDRSMIVEGVTLHYKLFVPANYDPTQMYPVILAAHGSGEMGSNNTSQLTVGFGPFVTARAATFPAFVVFPQIPNPSPVAGAAFRLDLYRAAFDSTLRQVHADSTRLYLTGISQGGFVAWSLAYQTPGLWAALLPIAGGATSWAFPGTSIASDAALAANALRLVPIWHWNGDQDGTVPIAQYAYPVRDAFAAVTPNSYQFSVGVGRGHEWDYVYNNPAVMTWFLAQHR